MPVDRKGLNQGGKDIIKGKDISKGNMIKSSGRKLSKSQTKLPNPQPDPT